MKTLQDILFGVSIKATVGKTAVEVEGIHFDSRIIQKGFVYVAQKGVLADGHDFIAPAISKGATAIICETLPDRYDEDIVYVKVENSSKTLGIVTSNFYDNPSKKLILLGVTGTNGKTTIASLLHALFSSEGYSSGLLSTVKISYASNQFENLHTTPDAVAINQHLYAMVEEGVTHCFMEVSSHGIVQNRIEGLFFSGAVFTNLTHDHLDYHGDFKSYRDTKKRFFDFLPKTAFALTNVDDKNGAYMLQNTVAKKYSYATRQHADFKAKILECQFSGMLLKIQLQDVWTSLIGKFNAQNLLAVYAVASLLEIPSLSILKRISELKSVNGRFQTFQASNKGTVVIDYAHTPDALENVLITLSTIRTRNESLITIVGCGGNRDQEKRPLIAEVAVRY
ncbi:MAG: UDP-N-acetylmuramoyl-L-alanyl-D-glutamate--2,6-diaminopimelate ligase, partial [Flavobacteriaceae bacterium]